MVAGRCGGRGVRRHGRRGVGAARRLLRRRDAVGAVGAGRRDRPRARRPLAGRRAALSRPGLAQRARRLPRPAVPAAPVGDPPLAPVHRRRRPGGPDAAGPVRLPRLRGDAPAARHAGGAHHDHATARPRRRGALRGHRTALALRDPARGAGDAVPLAGRRVPALRARDAVDGAAPRPPRARGAAAAVLGGARRGAGRGDRRAAGAQRGPLGAADDGRCDDARALPRPRAPPADPRRGRRGRDAHPRRASSAATSTARPRRSSSRGRTRGSSSGTGGYRRRRGSGVRLWRHDDARGPYLEVADPFDEVDDAHRPWQAAILPLLPQVYVTAERAEAAGEHWFRGYVAQADAGRAHRHGRPHLADVRDPRRRVARAAVRPRARARARPALPAHADAGVRVGRSRPSTGRRGRRAGPTSSARRSWTPPPRPTTSRCSPG